MKSRVHQILPFLLFTQFLEFFHTHRDIIENRDKLFLYKTN